MILFYYKPSPVNQCYSTKKESNEPIATILRVCKGWGEWDKTKYGGSAISSQFTLKSSNYKVDDNDPKYCFTNILLAITFAHVKAHRCVFVFVRFEG